MFRERSQKNLFLFLASGMCWSSTCFISSHSAPVSGWDCLPNFLVMKSYLGCVLKLFFSFLMCRLNVFLPRLNAICWCLR